ncbi:response regulator transcription factor [Yersinia bercovieri]|uniref:response regulator transcription factor n=2 Tax=Yersinia bercovieri TaxID=634 RepID=UPI001CFE591A|nr:LuxR C-terminal-related transcriptional regulator [Yersinia bercovieri]MCB5302360.1 helix-turn-helix transcriptional regulator [Yersinia bercovieri]
MNNILIFSNCDLIRYFFKIKVENALTLKPMNISPNVFICNSLSDFKQKLITLNDIFVIFDSDNVSGHEQAIFFDLIHDHVKKDRCLIFTKDPDLLGYYDILTKMSSFVLSKETSEEKVESMLYNIIHNPAVFLEKDSSADLLNRPKKSILSLRESQVFQCLILGMSNFDIARSLYISPRSMGGYRSKIFKKCKVDNLIELYERFN